MLRPCLCACLAVLTARSLPAQRSDGWSSHGHDLGGQRCSPLTAIDTDTVRRLVPKWTYHIGVSATFQATPIVVNRTMYDSLPYALFGFTQGDIVLAFGLAE